MLSEVKVARAQSVCESVLVMCACLCSFRPSLCCKLLDVSGRPGGAEHASPLETRSQGTAEDHRGRGGQLPRDSGAAAHPESSQGFPRPLDTGESHLNGGI